MRARTTASFIPDGMPTLSRGRHRSARRGACFMEYASYLAGERWSDAPRCTDPTLAALARAVNDSVGDDHRAELVPLIPRVVGLRGDDARAGLVVALRSAARALPVASFERQRALAVAVLATLDAVESRGWAEPALGVEARGALSEVPDAAAWAAGRLALWGVDASELVRRGCDAIIRASIVGIVQACIPDAEPRLVGLLRDAISDVEALVGRVEPGPRETAAASRASAPASV